jgi:hypothetical protein
MTALSTILVSSGLLSPETVEEMRKWGTALPEEVPEKEFDESSVAALAMAIESSITDQGYVLTRETDLDLLRQYVETAKNCFLVLKVGGVEYTKETLVGMTPNGEFIFSVKPDESDLGDILTNGETFLDIEDEEVYFSSAREQYYGDTKAFIVCTRSRV